MVGAEGWACEDTVDRGEREDGEVKADHGGDRKRERERERGPDRDADRHRDRTAERRASPLRSTCVALSSSACQ